MDHCPFSEFCFRAHHTRHPHPERESRCCRRRHCQPASQQPARSIFNNLLPPRHPFVSSRRPSHPPQPAMSESQDIKPRAEDSLVAPTPQNTPLPNQVLASRPAGQGKPQVEDVAEGDEDDGEDVSGMNPASLLASVSVCLRCCIALMVPWRVCKLILVMFSSWRRAQTSPCVNPLTPEPRAPCPRPATPRLHGRPPVWLHPVAPPCCPQAY